tara:strand:- start:259 stop:933 length:675 start_codon:yes stop_codon:yes gene_type:complete
MYEIQNTEAVENEFGIVIDDFLWNPRGVMNMLMTLDPIAHKKGCADRGLPDYNGKLFKDMRHTLYSRDLTPVYRFLAKWSKQPPLGNPQDPRTERRITTNVFRIKDDPFHTPDTHYWWPHFDMGWTAILYLNEEDDTGTNLYRSLCEKEEEEKDKTEEHYQPWRLKEKYELIHTFEPKFNRLVMFDGSKHCHGQNIHSKSELFRTNKARLNQVFFYDGKSNQNP